MKPVPRTISLCLLWALALWTSALFSAEFSLREMVRYVADVAEVFPIDVYEGTTAAEYQNWNCRYDLTYERFRPNCALYLIARDSTASEVLECLENLSEMTPKEKALTCAALIAFVKARDEEAQAQKTGKTIRRPVLLSSNPEKEEVRSFRDDEKRLALQYLEKEFADQSVAFSKIKDDPNARSEWEQNVREAIARFMRLDRGYDAATARSARLSFYAFKRNDVSTSQNESASLDSSEPERDGSLEFLLETNKDFTQTPIEFLCALILVQASFDESQLYNANFYQENKLVFRGAQTERELIAERFLLGRRSIPKYSDNVLVPMCEGFIMKEFLKTQFVAERAGAQAEVEPISGNSSRKDVLVSKVARRAIEVLNNE